MMRAIYTRPLPFYAKGVGTKNRWEKGHKLGWIIIIIIIVIIP